MGRLYMRYRWLIPALAGILAAWPPALALLLHRRIPMLAADAFYYFGLARRTAKFAVYTFDGVHATNGYHPLWLWTLSLWTRASDERLITTALIVQIVLVAIGTGMLTAALQRVTRRPLVALALAVPGLYPL